MPHTGQALQAAADISRQTRGCKQKYLKQGPTCKEFSHELEVQVLSTVEYHTVDAKALGQVLQSKIGRAQQAPGRFGVSKSKINTSLVPQPAWGLPW